MYVQIKKGAIMTTETTFKSSTTQELEKEIALLIRKIGMPWEEIEKEAQAYTLSDSHLSMYRTIKSLKWVTSGN